jgi:hypothetical protein
MFHSRGPATNGLRPSRSALAWFLIVVALIESVSGCATNRAQITTRAEFGHDMRFDPSAPMRSGPACADLSGHVGGVWHRGRGHDSCAN